MKKLLLLACSFSLYAQTGGLNIINGVIDFSAAGHTRPMIVVANVGALPATGCAPGDLAIVTAATLGQQIYQNSGTGACVWTQQLNTGSSSGGGITVYSAASLTLTGTQYIPIGGGGLPSATETNVDTAAPTAATITNFDVQMSAAPGVGISVVYTWRKNAASQSLTCTISGAVATSCSDNTHSFSVSQGDLLTIQIVTSGGVIAGTPNLVTSVQFGTVGSNGTVNSGTQFQIGEYLANGTAISGVTLPNCPAGNALNFNSSTGVFTCTGLPHAFVCNIGSATSSTAITTGDTGCYSDNGSYSGTINRVDIIGNAAALATCSITVDIWKANAAFPTSGNKISASAPATLSTAKVSQSGSLTGWTLGVAANDIWGATVATVTGCVYAQVRVEFQ